MSMASLSGEKKNWPVSGVDPLLMWGLLAVGLFACFPGSANSALVLDP